MLVLDLMLNKRNLTSQSSQPPLLGHSLKRWNLEEFVVSTRLARSLRRSMLNPSRRKSARLLSSRKSLISMFLFMESLRGMIWLSTLESSSQGLLSLLTVGFNPMDLDV
nr:uncharacterized protein LOC108844722 [Ipomoea batatas]GMD44900.1 uncharacterized protein LOC108844722 [Ipomoea batatas]GME08746.1 uncharacterized protein LOC108844722 [Ipomoea batatas]